MSEVTAWIMSTTPGQWALLIAFIVAVLKYGPGWHSQSFDEAEKMCKMLSNRVTELDHRLETCEKECREELLGLKANHAQEQLSFINMVIDAVAAPEFKALRSALETLQVAMRARVLHIQPGSVIPTENKNG